eukprot:jgi/Mesvir1/20997/Mv08056-RA.2
MPRHRAATHFRYGSIRWEPLGGNTVRFELKAAFRRDYDWGRYFKEQHSYNGQPFEHGGSIQGQLSSDSSYSGSGPDTSKWLTFSALSPEQYEGNTQLKFPVGYTSRGLDLAPQPTTPSVPKIENEGGRVCDTWSHKGVSNVNPLLPAGQTGLATDPKIMVCTPWAEVFGFFFGDGVPFNEGVILDVTNVDPSASLLGNVIRGTSEWFSHTYPAANNNGAPWKAFFTGGNRIINLNNNANGRYRLEVEVSIQGINRSPVVTQIPVLPVVYTDAPTHAQFQVSAFDPDFGDTVNYFLGTREEFGGVMANAINPTVFTWYRDVYEQEICARRIGPPSVCPLWDATWNTRFAAWSDTANTPHAPADLTIDQFSGLVTWETGRDPWTPTSRFEKPPGSGILVETAPKNPGFYNLVVMVADIDHPGTKVPVDFLLYLYPQMHYCSIDCALAGPDHLETFETTDGLYGDPDASAPVADQVYAAPGTGFCKLCGGGGVQRVLTFPAGTEKDVVHLQDSLQNSTKYCSVVNSVTNNALETGTPSYINNHGVAKPYACSSGAGSCDTSGGRPDAQEVGQGACMGARFTVSSTVTIIPYQGALGTCKMNTKPYFLTPLTVPVAGLTPPMGDIIGSGPLREPAVITAKLGQTVTFKLQATDDDDCVELEIGETGLFEGMELSDHRRLNTYSVERTFTWPPVMDGDDDVRDRNVIVCFYAFDKYLITADPFHCINIILTDNAEVVWCDQNPNPLPASFADMKQHGAIFEAYLNETMVIPLCVKKAVSPAPGVVYNLDIVPVSVTVTGGGASGFGGGYITGGFGETSMAGGGAGGAGPPAFIPFPFPYNEINFPASGYFMPREGDDPLIKNYAFSPGVAEECAYTVCFKGVDMDPAAMDETDIRCFMIKVKNGLLSFSVAEPAAYVAPTLSSDMTSNTGLSIAAWVYPSSANRGKNQTVLYFGSDRDQGNDNDIGGRDDGLAVRNAIKYWEKEEGIGQFFYFDCHIGDVFSPDWYCSDTWHYVVLTVAPNGAATLYVDGSERGLQMAGRRDVFKYSATQFTTPSRPDNSVDGDNAGTFVVGFLEDEPFAGMIDEVRVWNRPISAADVQRTMYARQLDAASEEGLVGYYTMRSDAAEVDMWYEITPGSLEYSKMNPVGSDILTDKSGQGNLLSPIVGFPAPAVVHGGIPPVIPCTLGLEHPVGPLDGACAMEVYGWGFADGPQLKCKFGGVEVPGVFVDDTTVLCSSPGGFSPRFVPVSGSNDGYNFTDAGAVGKEPKHLFMESSLFVDGINGAGAEADSVCQDLPNAAVSFGGWFCPKCGPQSQPSPPPPSPPPPSPPPPSPPPPAPEGGKKKRRL